MRSLLCKLTVALLPFVLLLFAPDQAQATSYGQCTCQANLTSAFTKGNIGSLISKGGEGWKYRQAEAVPFPTAVQCWAQMWGRCKAICADELNRHLGLGNGITEDLFDGVISGVQGVGHFKGMEIGASYYCTDERERPQPHPTAQHIYLPDIITQCSRVPLKVDPAIVAKSAETTAKIGIGVILTRIAISLFTAPARVLCPMIILTPDGNLMLQDQTKGKSIEACNLPDEEEGQIECQRKGSKDFACTIPNEGEYRLHQDGASVIACEVS
jgi:hypothetical protein